MSLHISFGFDEQEPGLFSQGLGQMAPKVLPFQGVSSLAGTFVGHVSDWHRAWGLVGRPRVNA